jgi:hypothetical protein
MSKAIQTGNSATLPAAIQGLGNALIQEGQSSTGMGDLLRFMSRDGGTWTFGAEGVVNEDGSRWAVNPLSFEMGYVCWKAKKVAGEAMVAFGTARPPRESLVDHGSFTDPKGKVIQTKWDEQMSIRLKCVEGEDAGTEVTFKSSTVGGISCVKALAKAVGARISSGKMDVVAVVELTNTFYTHAEYGKTYVPEMAIESWTDMDEDPAAPAAKAEAPEEVEEVEEVVEDMPVRRRRSRTA